MSFSNFKYSTDKQRFRYSLVIPVLLLLIIWISKVTEIILNSDFTEFGVFPRQLSGLKGIIFSPFIHANWVHLFSNSVPFLILCTAIIYFYRDISYRVIIFSFLFSGIGVWFIGRPSYHVGASGVVYSFASFLFFSGIFRKDSRLMALSLTVVFVYGGMIWGILPIIPDMSWESHLSGGITGLVLSFIYQNKGPQRKKFDWENESDDEDNDQNSNISDSEGKVVSISDNTLVDNSESYKWNFC